MEKLMGRIFAHIETCGTWCQVSLMYEGMCFWLAIKK